jgi:hypothetical protein
MEGTTNNENTNTGSTGKGRGWRGDSDGHKRAGRLGGLARKINRSNQTETEQQES